MPAPSGLGSAWTNRTQAAQPGHFLRRLMLRRNGWVLKLDDPKMLAQDRRCVRDAGTTWWHAASQRRHIGRLPFQLLARSAISRSRCATERARLPDRARHRSPALPVKFAFADRRWHDRRSVDSTAHADLIRAYGSAMTVSGFGSVQGHTWRQVEPPVKGKKPTAPSPKRSFSSPRAFSGSLRARSD